MSFFFFFVVVFPICRNHSVEEGYDPSKARSKGKGAKKVPDLFGKPGVDITTTKVRKQWD